LQKLIILLIVCCLQLSASPQYFQQKVDYVIDVTLNDKEKTLDAFEKITYYNNSNDTLSFIWFHLWYNAYKNDRTAFSDQLLENGSTKFYFSNKEERGYINRLDFKVEGITAKTEDHPQHIDIIKLILPKRLAPHQKIIITTPFHVKLPFNFSRGGYDGETFQITQWYPKPAVYDSKGWHEMPYLDQGEFYSEFGNFDVRITTPSNYVIAATGELQNEEEKDWLQNRKNFSWKPLVRKIAASSNKNAPLKKTTQLYPESSSTTKTINYKQNNVHDFAWFADKTFIADKDTLKLSSGKIVDVFTFYQPKHSAIWKNSIQYAKDAVRFYSNEVGEYPYNTVSIVLGPQSFGGGMEYPTITIISPISTDKQLDIVIAHEVGHNWFQGILASNERDYPWMDEGINSYYENKYAEWKYGRQSQEIELLFLTKVKRKTDQPIITTSEAFSENNYGLVAYHKTAEWMKLLEKEFGKDAFNKAMQQYFQHWKFKHPYPDDFQALLKNSLGDEAKKKFELLKTKGVLPVRELPVFKIVSPFKKGSIKSYLEQPTKNILFFSPVIGANSYDKLMIGGLITNYKLPPGNFQFLLAPLYAIGTKDLKWLAKLNYAIASEGFIRKTDFFLNASSFSMNKFVDTFNTKHFTSFEKIAPGFRLNFKEKNPRSTISKFLQWKTFFISEQNFKFGADTIINTPDTAYRQKISLVHSNYYINQLKFVYQNSRVLYPFNIDLQIEQSKDFIRPALTANYFFNYREGGISLRFFAGKFFYSRGKTISKQFKNERYFLNLTGPNGYEDYTYSDYFTGRNYFDGFQSQQILMRDGGFKVRTDLLSSKIGKTDNWLTAINFNSTIPKRLNPLSVLPIKIPLRLFLDIGTYAEAWEKDAEGDRFLYDFGFHIPLFSDVVNFYFPVLYNKEYSDYFKSTIPKNRLFKTMSFTINLYNNDLKKINRELEF
jgi:hypothetical protein